VTVWSLDYRGVWDACGSTGSHAVQNPLFKSERFARATDRSSSYRRQRARFDEQRTPICCRRRRGRIERSRTNGHATELRKHPALHHAPRSAAAGQGALRVHLGRHRRVFASWIPLAFSPAPDHALQGPRVSLMQDMGMQPIVPRTAEQRPVAERPGRPPEIVGTVAAGTSTPTTTTTAASRWHRREDHKRPQVLRRVPSQVKWTQVPPAAPRFASTSTAGLPRLRRYGHGTVTSADSYDVCRSTELGVQAANLTIEPARRRRAPVQHDHVGIRNMPGYGPQIPRRSLAIVAYGGHSSSARTCRPSCSPEVIKQSEAAEARRRRHRQSKRTPESDTCSSEGHAITTTASGWVLGEGPAAGRHRRGAAVNGLPARWSSAGRRLAGVLVAYSRRCVLPEHRAGAMFSCYPAPDRRGWSSRAAIAEQIAALMPVFFVLSLPIIATVLLQKTTCILGRSVSTLIRKSWTCEGGQGRRGC